MWRIMRRALLMMNQAFLIANRILRVVGY
jgi:hypothetical protein